MVMAKKSWILFNANLGNFAIIYLLFKEGMKLNNSMFTNEYNPSFPYDK